jgi:hypothetical protein
MRLKYSIFAGFIDYCSFTFFFALARFWMHFSKIWLGVSWRPLPFKNFLAKSVAITFCFS